MIRAQIHRICDRCNKAYSLEQFDVSKGLPADVMTKRPPVEIRQGEELVARFEDLCEDCERVVDKLLSRIVLEKESRKKQGGDDTQGPESTTDSIRTTSDDSGDGESESEGGDHDKEGGAADDEAPVDPEASPADGAESATEQTSENEGEHPF